MNKLSWTSFANTEDVTEYRVYRSSAGPVLGTLAIVSDPVLIRFAATSPEIQEFEVNCTSEAAFVADFNSKARGAEAVIDGTLGVIIRATASGPSVLFKTYSSEFWALNTIPSGTPFRPGGIFNLVGTVPFVDAETLYEFEDASGIYNDKYRVTSYDGVTESKPSATVANPVPPGYDYCVVYGRFIDPQGRPVRGVRVEAEMALAHTCGMSQNKITAISDDYGRINLPLLQKMNYRVSIPAIGYNEVILIPEERSINIATHPATLGTKFSPFGDPE